MPTLCQMPRQMSSIGWCALLIMWALPVAAQNVVISEVMYRPGPEHTEWIEIYNAGVEPVDLQGWRLGDDADPTGRPITDRRVMLRPNVYMALGPKDANFSKYPKPRRILRMREGFPRLNNHEDSVTLMDSTGRRRDHIHYTSSWGGERTVSLERINPRRSGNNERNWGSSNAEAGGTPGQPNSISRQTNPAKITWILDPNPFSPNGDGIDDIVLITWKLPVAAAKIKLQVLNPKEQPVRTLLNNTTSKAEQSTLWDGRNREGQTVAPGVYLLDIEAQEQRTGKKYTSRMPLVLGGQLPR